VGVVFVALVFAQPRLGLWAWLLFSPLALKYATVSLPVGLPDVTLGRVVVALVTVVFALRVVLFGERLKPLRALDWAILVLSGIMVLDLLGRAENLTSEALQNFDEMGIPVLLYVAARHLLTRASDLKWATYAVIVVGLSLAAHGAYQFARFSAPTPSMPVIEVVRVDGARVNEDFLSEGRSLGPFGSPVEFGSVAAICFTAAFVLALRRFHGISRTLGWVALAPCAVAVVLSATRAAWLGPIVGVLVVAALDRQRRPTIMLSLGVAVALAIAIVMVVLPRSEIFRERAFSIEPIYARTLMYRIGFTLAAREPLTGCGRGAPALRAAGAEADAMGGSDAEIAAGQFHNTFLMTLVEWGVAGLAAYIAVLVCLLGTALAVRRQCPDDQSFAFHAAGFYVAALAIFVLQNVFVDTPSFLYLNGLMFLFAGILQAARDRHDAEARPHAMAAVPAAP
jgi:O-antigen ligase